MKLLKVAKREYMERVRKKSFLIGTILGPLLMGSMIIVPGFIFEHAPERQFSVSVVDSTGFIFERFEEILADTLANGTRMFKLREVQHEGRNLDEIKSELGLEVESDLLD
jgi:ABC-type Na+ efflux pump permease subunit